VIRRKSLILFTFVLSIIFCFALTSVALAGTTQLDKYVSVTSVKMVSDGKYEIKYKTLQKRASTYEKVTLSYEFPAEYRMSGGAQEIDYNLGNHVAYFNNVPKLAGFIYLKATYSAYSYKEPKSIYSGVQIPQWYSNPQYWELTKSDVLTYKVFSMMPGIVAELHPAAKRIKYLPKYFMGWSIYKELATTFSNTQPDPSPGQYYKIQTSVSSSGLITTTTTIWNTKASYSKGETPLWSGSAKYQLPK